jgi:superfamily II DNA or RNA helicase
MWKNSKYHLGIPRAHINPQILKYPIVDLTPKQYQHVDIKSSIVLDARRPELDYQKKAFKDLISKGDGILNLACGLGKTVIALHALAHWKVPTLIISNTAHTLDQWKKEITKHLNITNNNIGWIQSNPSKWNWQHPITLANLKSLAMYAKEAPLEMLSYFGVIIWDECHTLATNLFSVTADMFYGKRIGLTATINRPDGQHRLYLSHIGQAVHVNLTQDIEPTVVFLKSPTEINLNNQKVFNECTDKEGNLHYIKLAAHVGCLDQEVQLAKSIIDEGMKRKKIMYAITCSKTHAQKLHKEYPNSGVLHGSVLPKNRLSMLHDYDLTFGTVKLATEALDKATLNSLIILTEFTSEKNMQQSMGRIQRFLKDKKATVIVVWHHKVEYLSSMGRKLMSLFRKEGIKVKVV